MRYLRFCFPPWASEVPADRGSRVSIAAGNFKRGYCIVDRWDIRILRDPFTQKPYVIFYIGRSHEQ